MLKHERYGIVKKVKLKQKMAKLPKTLHLISHSALSTRRGVLVLVAVVIGLGSVGVPMVRADDYDAQIKQLQQENADKNASLDQLGAQAVSLQDQISKLQQEIAALEAQIAANQAKSDDLQKQIVAAEAELVKQRKVLGENIKTMYLEGQISTLEMLASSKDLSDFVDRQQYRDSVQAKIKDTLDKITALKIQLKNQKSEVEGLLKDQQNMRTQIAAQQAQQNQLLSANQSQQAALDQQIKDNNSKVAQLRAAQAAANRRLNSGGGVIAGDPGHGGYPARWDNAPQDSMVDSWGMYNRECVSYTAWKVYETYGYMPYWGGVGNANEWPGNARRANIQTSSTPRAQSVAIWNVGYYGHAMWVEQVNDDGSIWISQYNYDYTGHYSEMKVSAGMAASLTYIYFN